jgi:hypothetical protein
VRYSCESLFLFADLSTRSELAESYTSGTPCGVPRSAAIDLRRPSQPQLTCGVPDQPQLTCGVPVYGSRIVHLPMRALDPRCFRCLSCPCGHSRPRIRFTFGLSASRNLLENCASPRCSFLRPSHLTTVPFVLCCEVATLSAIVFWTFAAVLAFTVFASGLLPCGNNFGRVHLLVLVSTFILRCSRPVSLHRLTVHGLANSCHVSTAVTAIRRDRLVAYHGSCEDHRSLPHPFIASMLTFRWSPARARTVFLFRVHVFRRIRSTEIPAYPRFILRRF